MRPGGAHAVVLAAGAGSRFGGSKLTAPYEGGVLLDAALRSACLAPVKSIVVVTGAHADLVSSAVAAFASGSLVPVRLAHCADHSSGMFASIRRGLETLPEDAAAAFLFLGDMPLVSRTVSSKLLAAVHAGALAAVPSVGGTWGHPVLASRALFSALCRSAGDGGGRVVLRGLGGDLAVIDVDDEGILLDVDTVADLDAIQRYAPAPAS